MILEHYNRTFDLPGISTGARASVVGTIRTDGQFVVTYRGEKVVDARAKDVTRGLQYNRPFSQPEKKCIEPDLPEPTSYNETLLSILGHENVASREPIYEHYDKQVQGLTVIEPGDGDAGVMQPFRDGSYPADIRSIGIALSVDHNPRYGKIDPYWCGVNAVVEAMRNVAAVGATPHALTDCLNFGNPEKPEQMWEFVEGTRGVADAAKGIHLKDHPDYAVPIISGNVSLYKESKGKAIPPSPIIACLGRLQKVSRAITMHFKKTDSKLFLIGERRDECGGSIYYQIRGELGANCPKPELTRVERQIFALTDAIDRGCILSAHDISDGGIATTIAEMSFRYEIGADVFIPGSLRTDKKLFGETGGFVIEVQKNFVKQVQDIFAERDVTLIDIGKTTEEKRSRMNGVIDMNLLDAKQVWNDGLRNKL